MRFIAALGVLLYHYQLYGLVVFPPFLGRLVAFGRNGVELFFVLSGYIITYNYLHWFRDDLNRRGAFLWARVARITPMYLVGLLLMTPISLLLVNVDQKASPALIVISWVLNALHLQAWLPSPTFNRWDLPSWSVSAEMFFYWLFPAFAYGVLRHCRNRRAITILIACLYVAGAVVVGGLFLTLDGHFAGATFSPIVRVWEFLIGCGLGALRLRAGSRTSLRFDARLWFVLIALVVCAYILPTELWDSVGWYAVGLPLLATFVALLGAGPSRLGSVLAQRWLTRLGEASYSLYLLHWIPMTLAIYATSVALFRPGLASVVLISLVIVASLGCHRWIETPARQWVRAHQPAPLANRPAGDSLATTFEGQSEGARDRR